MLMTVLETLIYDPLVDWKGKKGKREPSETVGESEIRTGTPKKICFCWRKA